MINTIYKLADSLRGSCSVREMKELIFCETLYAICSQFKSEEQYLRDPHLISNYLGKIDSLKLSKTPTSVEMLDQLSPFELNFHFSENLNIKANLALLEKLDFTKDIIRGTYQNISKTFNEIINYLLSGNTIGFGGEISTPEALNLLLKGILKVKSEENLLDPCYGTGAMALEIGSHAKMIYGQEINQGAYTIGKINSIICNIQHKIKRENSLLSLDLPDADVVVTNSPFAIKPRIDGDCDYLKWGIPSKSNGDFYFISLVLSKMKERGAIILPEGALYKSGKEGVVRQKIIESNFIEGVISLPTKVFSHTGIVTSILIFSKSKTSSDILFIDAKDFFMQERGRASINKEGINKIIEIYENKSTIKGVSDVKSIDEIRVNDFVLTVNRYIRKEQNKEPVDLDKLSKKVLNKKIEVRALQDKTDALIEAIR